MSADMLRDAARSNARTQEEERIAREIDERTKQGILGPDGRPLMKALVKDRTITFAQDGESISQDPDALLMAAARMQRDGASLSRIRKELDIQQRVLVPGVGWMEITNATLQRAIDRGHALLAAAIRAGTQPAESLTVEGYEYVDAGGDDD